MRNLALAFLSVLTLCFSGLVAQSQQPDGSTQLNADTGQASKLAAQEDQAIVDRPFRRIFVPQSELPEFSLDNLRPLDIDKLPAALDRIVRRNNESIDPWVTTSQSLRSIHGVARLVGADLLSERTRLVWLDNNASPSGSSSENQTRERLSPWNLAIESMPEELAANQSSQANKPNPERRTENDLNAGSSSSMTPPAWVFDPSGKPLLQRRTNESWIRWSLKPTSESTPNRLEFEALIPKTVDGCFILLLPKSARVEKSNVVLRKIEGWEQAAERLSKWPDRNPSLGTSVAPNIENTYWILEISGTDKVSFTIDLGSNTSRGQSLETPKDWGIDRLFSKQTLQYSVYSNELRILADWEWNEQIGNNPPIKLDLPDGMKIRSASINDREPLIQIDRTQVLIPIPDSPTNPGPGTSAKFRMTAEFLIPRAELKPDEAGSIVIPPIRNSNGAVLFGNTILQDQKDGRFVSVSSERSRLESARKTTEGLHRLEYSWNRNPPDMRCNIDSTPVSNQIESIVRLSTDAQRCIANVRLRLSEPNSAGIELLKIPVGWIVDPTTLSVRPQAAAGIAQLNAAGDTLQLDRNRWSGSDAIVDLQLSKNLESGGEIRLGDLPWLLTNNQLIRTCFYVEPNASNRLFFRGRTKPWILSDEDLSTWQRDSLPRLGGPLVLGTRDDKLPPLVASSLEESLVIPIETKVRRTPSHWRVEHRLRISPEWSEFPEIHVQLPPSFQWHFESTQRLPLTANYDTNTSEWILQLSSLAIDPEIDGLGTIVATQLVQSQDENLHLHRPWIREAKRSIYQLDLPETLILKHPNEKAVEEKPNRNGYIYEWIENASQTTTLETGVSNQNTIEIIDTRSPSNQSVVFFDSTLNLIIDGFGSQGAELISRVFVPSNSDGEITLRHPPQWQITDCYTSNGGNKHTAGLHKSSSTQTKIALDSSSLQSQSLIYVRLIGPKFSDDRQHSSWTSHLLTHHESDQTLSLKVPEFDFEQGKLFFSSQSLWFPDSLQLGIRDSQGKTQGIIETSPSSLPNKNPRWNLWNWTRQAWHSLSASRKTLPDALEKNLRSVNSPSMATSMATLGNWTVASLDDPRIPENAQLVLYRPAVANWAGWLTVCSAVFSAGFFRRWPRMLMFIALTCWIGAIWITEPLSIFAQQLFIGIGVGGILLRLYQIVSPASLNHPSSIRSDRSSIWDPKNISDPIDPTPPKNHRIGSSSLTLWLPWILFPIGLSSLCVSPILNSIAQDPTSNTAKVFDILIPINDQNELAGTTIYVPEELLKLIEAEEREKRQRESMAMIAASKHYLRLDSRSFGFGNADQPLTSSYEMWISDSAVGRAVRFPFPSDSLKLSRFSVDGVEVLSGRLTRTDSELIWYPERPGRRSVQIESQLKMRSLENLPTGVSFGALSGTGTSSYTGSMPSEKRSNKLWTISTDILPVGNAILEVETDGAWLVAVTAQGRSINPSVGRSIVQLGNKDRIEGYFQPPTTPGSRPSLLSMPNEVSPTNIEFPSMNTELFLDNDQLIARTIIEYPPNQAISGEVEIESDSMWLPIGTHWGDATLIDVRTGSTLDRRRYIVRWNPTTAEDPQLGFNSPQKRSIVTTWVPIGDSALRSVLFAECRDRRVRQGVLRYARSPGSIWTLDGISSWIPAINSKDRLDWPELKDPPLTTNLRIPVSSGFGVLRRQTFSATEQRIATNKIHLDSDKVRLTTSLKLSGQSIRRNPLIFEIPNGYRIDRVLSLSGPLEFITWTDASKTQVQILVDRQADSLNEILIEWSSRLNHAEQSGFDFTVPQLQFSAGWTSPPSFELSADPSWIVRNKPTDPANNFMLQGKGDNQDLLKDFTTSSDVPAIHVSRTPSNYNGMLLVRMPEPESQIGLRIYGIRSENQNDPWHGVELSIPKEMIASWSSRNPTFELPDLRWNHRLLSIDPPPTTLSDDKNFSIDFMIELTPESDSVIDAKLLEEILINGMKPSDMIIAAREPFALPGIGMESSEIVQKFESAFLAPLEIDEKTWKLGVLSDRKLPIDADQSNPNAEYSQEFAKHSHISQRVWLSEFWIEQRADFLSAGSMHWTVPQGWNCSLVQVNGEVFPFRQTGSDLELFYPPIDSSTFVRMWCTMDPNLDQSISVPLVPSLVSSLPKGESIIPSDKSSKRSLKSATKLEYNAWKNTILRQTQIGAVPQDHAAWRYSASRFAQLLWNSSSSTGEQERSLSPEEYAQGIETLMSLPWNDSEDYRLAMQPILTQRLTEADILNNQYPVNTVENPNSSGFLRSVNNLQVLYTLVPLVGLLLFLVSWRHLNPWLQKRPWWNLLSVALAWWIITGDLWLPSLIALGASILAIDTYWMISVQFRQTGIRAPR